MNEQEQAELLAAWLEDPGSGTPEDLDTDVVEAAIALHPELAPAPRLSVDDILGGVRSGPLVNPMPTGASVALKGSSEQRRPWWLAAVGVGGMGSLVAAAALLLVLSSTLLPSAPERELASSEPTQAAPISAPDGVALVDTGLKPSPQEQRARPSRPPRPRVANKPKPLAIHDGVAMEDDFDDRVDAGSPVTADASEDLDQVAGIPELLDRESPADQPAKSLEEEPPAQDLTPVVAARPAAKPTPAAPASPPVPPAEGRAVEPERGPTGSGYGAGVGELEEYDSEDLAAPAPAEATSGSRRQTRREVESKKELGRSVDRRKHKERQESKSDRAPGNRAASAPSAEVPLSLAEQARVGTEQATSPEVRAAVALLTGDPRAALAAIDAGLLTHTTNTAERQRLLVLRGDALTQLGDPQGARSAYQQAIALAASR